VNFDLTYGWWRIVTFAWRQSNLGTHKMSDLDSQKTSDQLREEHLLERARGGDAGAARELFALCRPKVRMKRV